MLGGISADFLGRDVPPIAHAAGLQLLLACLMTESLWRKSERLGCFDDIHSDTIRAVRTDVN